MKQTQVSTARVFPIIKITGHFPLLSDRGGFLIIKLIIVRVHPYIYWPFYFAPSHVRGDKAVVGSELLTLTLQDSMDFIGERIKP